MSDRKRRNAWFFSLLIWGISACSSSSIEPKEQGEGATEKLIAIEGDNAAEISEGNEADLGGDSNSEGTEPNSGTVETEGESGDDLLADTEDPAAEGPESTTGEASPEAANAAELNAEASGNIAPDLAVPEEENIEQIALRAAEEAGIPLEDNPPLPTETVASVPPGDPAPATTGEVAVANASSIAPSEVPMAAPPAEPQMAAGQELASQLSTVKWVGYRFEKAKGLLTIEILNTLPIDYDVFSAADKRRETGFLFRFYQSRLSRKLRYALDSSEFCSPVNAISMFENSDGGYVDVFVKHTPRYKDLADQGQLVEGTTGGRLERGSVQLLFNLPECDEAPATEKVAVKERAISLLAGEANPFGKSIEAKVRKSPQVGLMRKDKRTLTAAIPITEKIRRRPSLKIDKQGLPESFDHTLARRGSEIKSSLYIRHASLLGVAADELPESDTEASIDAAPPEAEMAPANAAPAEAALPGEGAPAMEAEPAPMAAESAVESAPEAPAQDLVGQATPEPASIGKAYAGKAVVLDFYDAPLSLVLASLKEQTGHTYIYTESVGQTRVTVHFNNVPWDEALEAILQTYGLASARIGDSIVRIDQITEIAKTKQARDDAEKATSTQVLVFPLNHAKAEDLESRIKTLLPDGSKLTFDKRTNKVIVEASKKTIAKVKEIIRRLDTETPQVEIVSRIVEVRKSFSNQFGISWLNNLNFDPGRALGFGTLNFPNSLTSNFAVDPGVSTDATAGAARFRFGSLNKFIDLDLLLKMEEKKGTTNILQSNRVLVLDNESALIKQGTKRENIQQAGAQVGGVAVPAGPVPSSEAFLSLEVTPQVSAANTVRMKLKITSDNFLDAANSPIQTTNKKELTTNMLRGSGETGVIGGIYDTKKAVSMRGVPFLSDIPILGALFRRSLTEEEQSELLIMVTPTIMPTESGSSEEDVAALKNPLEWKEESVFSRKDTPGKTPTTKF